MILDLVLVDMRINNLLLIYQTLKVREKYFCLLFVFFPSSSRAFSFLLLFLLFLFFGFSEDYHLSIYYLLSWFQELFFFNIVYSINFFLFGIWKPYLHFIKLSCSVVTCQKLTYFNTGSITVINYIIEPSIVFSESNYLLIIQEYNIHIQYINVWQSFLPFLFFSFYSV